MLDKLSNNKKLLLILGAILLLVLIILLAISFKPADISEESTDSTAATNDLTLEAEFAEANPILSLLPLESTSPFYRIDPYFTVTSDGQLSLSLEITYQTPEGLSAAETRLRSSEFSAYSVSQYPLLRNQL